MKTTTFLRRSRLAAPLVAALCLAGCQSEAGPPGGQGPPVPQVATNREGEKAMKIQVTSAAFAEGKPIPKKYSGEGEDVSPPLAWDNLPEGTKELALICDDPDAPIAEPWVHWVIYKIPADAKGLPEALPDDATLKEPIAALQGKNFWKSGQTVGYRGPMPPPGHGTHRYYFKLYALDAPLALEPAADKKTLLEKIKGHVLGEGQLMGTYERK